MGRGAEPINTAVATRVCCQEPVEPLQKQYPRGRGVKHCNQECQDPEQPPCPHTQRGEQQITRVFNYRMLLPHHSTSSSSRQPDVSVPDRISRMQEQQLLFTESCSLELIMRDKQQPAMKLQGHRGCSSCQGTLWEQVLPYRRI